MAVRIPVLRMASELGERTLAAVLREDDLLRLEGPHPRGGGSVWFATVVDNGELEQMGRVGVVRSEWIKPMPTVAVQTMPPTARQSMERPELEGVAVESYVDNFRQVIYDPDYRLAGTHGPTSWLQVQYDDNAKLDLLFTRIYDKPTMDTRQALSKATRGEADRVFPAEMNPQTTPRLWAAKQTALEEQNRLTLELMKAALPAVFFVITAPPMPVGRAPSAPRSASSRRVSKGVGAQSRGRAQRLDQVRSTRVSLAPLQQKAQSLVQKLRQAGKRVVLNLGGAGAPHEPRDAINLNLQIPGTQRKEIPNLIQAAAEEMASLFNAGDIDEVVGFNLSPGTFNWERVASGAASVLKSGGKFNVHFRWPDHGIALQLAKALSASGFVAKTVEIIADARVIASFR